jgi:hypothetical protein
MIRLKKVLVEHNNEIRSMLLFLTNEKSYYSRTTRLLYRGVKHIYTY